ncbi:MULTISPECIES: cellulase-like family protein [Actinoalloteichus]|uniref:Sugar-binding cellulase n=1 Tax=Actinoalloteichus fjordicus TaxID=1612552 RepID=A0AAC9PU18_9PSEU|nr:MULTISPECIES: cellulase-like family protein [Actinoalloteichus]APU16476.1 Sugar-binding cellulase [Actinoalloteichus fjordicus]APU22535.1 Sugar-binding cellulase [Actinoalloteichus sp. GBA129-24]
MPTPLPANLPPRLTISLWDFSWYTRTGPGEPFADLDAAFAQAVERGYNTIRICAMPLLLFGSGLDTSALRFGPLGGEYGQRVRWYDVRKTTEIDGRAHLLALFEAARRHDCHVILSSWEYQQSPAFAADRAWLDAVNAVDPEDRAEALADALADLVDFLAEHGLDDRIAFTELHNEVQAGHLADGLDTAVDRVVALRPRLERGIARFRRRHPDRPVTVNYAEVPVGSLRGIPRDIDIAVFHPYVYGVLDEMLEVFALRDAARPFPQERARRELLRPGAPGLADWAPPEADRWRQEATVVGDREVYLHDWCDPVAFDAWLYERYAVHRLAMEQRLTTWIAAAADWAAERGIPLVFGEGWIGYTPLYGTFEEGPIGANFCRRAVAESVRVGALGTVVCSNAAPQHPMWADVALQRECNEAFLR